ncbi:probable calcium-binding protein CML10 [Lycium ferocissimum]|uniref:probable calcium-binding protein CML10 n=1 Tax=Lycium ferocissimum TaxID=112874 RepID=UPI002815C4CE|nr:probable calcium-binding protein CML10 [Lycium ferocissimum]
MAWLIFKDASIPVTEEQLEKVLKRYDENKDGKLSKQELKTAFKEMGLRFCGWKASRAFHHADINGDGYISKDEMKELVKYSSNKWGITTY